MLAFPQETTEQLRRRILDICQDHLRKTVDCLREVCLMVASYQNGDEASVYQHSNKVMKYDEEATEIKRTIMKEVAEVGSVLMSREDFIRLSSEINAITSYCTGVAYRISEMTKRKWQANLNIMKSIGNLAEASLETVIRLRETVLSLSYGSAKVFETAKNVESAERITDSIYRKIDFTVTASNMELKLILLLREVALFLENMADMAENANDTAEIISLTT